MSSIALRPRPVSRLDYKFLLRVFLILGFLFAFVAPVAPDPLAFGVAALMPLLLLGIIGTPLTPAAVYYVVLWQWGQIFARAVQTVSDGESLVRGINGAYVLDAYWYMLASVVALAVGF